MTLRLPSLRQEYLRCGLWAQKEPMDRYLYNALEKGTRYVAFAKLSSEEQQQYQKVKAWYEKQYVPQTSNLLPFIPLKAIGQSYEQDRGYSLSQRQIDTYLSEGFAGPIPIRSIHQDLLDDVSKRFKDFHKNANRKNLGSVYSMLQNRCMWQIATNREILSKVASILGEDIMLSNFTVNELAPGLGKSTLETGGMVDSLNCHSDLSSGSQYHFEVGTNSVRNLALDNRCVNVWLSISGTNLYNAPLYLFPQTHFWDITTPFTHIDEAKDKPEQLDHVLKLLSLKQGSPFRRIGLYNIEYRSLLSSRYLPLVRSIPRIEVYTKPGECIFFNAHTRHGSGINQSPHARLAITLRFNTALTEAGGMETAGAVANMAERRALGIENDPRKPMVQLLGNKHHPNNLPLDLSKMGTL